MKVTKLTDKLGTGFRHRLDDLTTNELVTIEMAIESMLKEQLGFIENYKNDDDYERLFRKSCNESVDTYNNILNAINNEKVVPIDCYRIEVSDMEFEKIIKKYKKVKI